MPIRSLPLIVLFLPLGLWAQGADQQHSLEAVDRFFTALNKSDTTALGQLMVRGSQFVLLEEREPRTVHDDRARPLSEGHSQASGGPATRAHLECGGDRA